MTRSLAGAGDDYVEAGDATASGDDRIDAGDGSDTVAYGEAIAAAAGVTIDLAAGTARGERQGLDVLAGVEHAVGGHGPDTLVGEAGANRLRGLGGRDRLVGGGGADYLAGGAGRDAIDGGDGDDLLIAGTDGLAGDRSFDTFACGPGSDAIKFALRRDVVGPDCEALDNTAYPPDALGPRFDPHPRVARGAPRVPGALRGDALPDRGQDRRWRAADRAGAAERGRARSGGGRARPPGAAAATRRAGRRAGHPATASATPTR